MNALHAYLSATSITSRDFAKDVGTSESTISRLRRGLQVPSMPLIEKIVEKTQGAVSADSFLSEENRALVASALALVESPFQPEVSLNG